MLIGCSGHERRKRGTMPCGRVWPIAVPSFSTVAWKLSPRQDFIGWTSELREKNLPLAADNRRLLILRWVEIPNPGSRILAIVRRRQAIEPVTGGRPSRARRRQPVSWFE